jgi:hypothetical protein
MTSRDWLTPASEPDEMAELRAENVRLHELLASCKRLNETLAWWGCEIGRRWAEDKKGRGRKPKVSDADVIRRLVEAWSANGHDIPQAKKMVRASLKAEGISITTRRIEQIMKEVELPVRVSRIYRLLAQS